MTARESIVAAAREWLGTPYRHAADVKGAGVDCGMLLIRVYADLGLIPAFNPRPYPPDWMMHRDEERYLGWVRQFGHEIETPEPGDLVVFKIARCFAHGGIVTRSDPLRFIHAHAPARRVTEDALAHVASLKHRERLAFSVL